MKNYSDFKRIKTELDLLESDILSPYAVLSNEGIRRHSKKDLESSVYRQSFSCDVDRIMNSLSYARYVDKTQVFCFISNDHVTHRMLHVQLVSKIARTIGRFLKLNEDLIESISLGHDIGHPPFGHDGEVFLSKLCNKSGIGNFFHNVQSIQFLDKIERRGNGCNLCLQTLDGILCHNGEVHSQVIKPFKNKNFEFLDKEISKKKKMLNYELFPMTLEGCVVRVADTIGYIGRDLEDAIRLNLLKRYEIPKDIIRCLGNTNSNIVHNLVTDVIQNSNKNFIGFSLKSSYFLQQLKQFNYKVIYTNSKIKKHLKIIEKLFGILFNQCIIDLVQKNVSSNIFLNFLHGMSDSYIKNHSNPEIVRDYISGMTDGYFLKQFYNNFK